jgi:phosphatidylethanolamine/phosphatidyl-N-methylethanolamine N-methyltransferase
MELQDTLRTYRLFAGPYDLVFGPIFHPGRKDAVRIANDRPRQRILEVGVGTGLSLPYFRPDSEVIGIDVSAEMLARARSRVARRRLGHVTSLVEMDAENLTFDNDSFDSVLALYVASVVPDPARFAAEMRRVCRPGGTIVVVNHFASELGLMRWVEQKLAPLAGKIGFHSDFSFQGFIADSQLSVRERRPSNLFGYWTLLRCVNDKAV